MCNKFYEEADKLHAKIIERYRLGGIQFIVFFDNGYGCSIIRNPGSYGYERGEFELAVISGTIDDYHLCYNTPITDDVLGWLTVDDVIETMKEVSKLKISAE